MIRFIRGEYLYYDGTAIILDTPGGIGYRIFVPDTSPLLNNREGDTIVVNTFLQVKEDGMFLYGFPDTDSLELFEQLITVKSVGPKAGLAIMALAEPDVIKQYIVAKDASFVARASGIGKKTAERVILELCDKLVVTNVDALPAGKDAIIGSSSAASAERQEAIIALTTLGYSKAEAKDVVMRVEDEGLKAEEYIKAALKYLM